MIYRLGIITENEVPFVIMEEVDNDGVVVGEKKEVKKIYVQGTLTSNKFNQLVLETKSAKEIVNTPDDLPKNE